MPELGSNLEQLPVKMLLIAHSGFGKTGSLASLAAAGYKLHILDYDNGTEVLLGYLDKQYWPNVEYETFTDKFKVLGDKAMPLTALAWQQGIQKLDKWITAHNTTEHIMVLDSLTMISQAAFRHILYLNKRLGTRPYQSDFGEAQRLIEDLLAFLYSKDVKCHIIVNSHISYIGGPDPNADENKKDEQNSDTVKPLQGLPTSIGKALSPNIPRYFNNMVVGKVVGEGSGALRQLYTVPMDLVPAKTSVKLKASYPIATGLADIFKALR